MAQENTVATLDGLFKQVYGKEGPIPLVPEIAYIQKRVTFKEAERIGKNYNFPVVLSQEQGVTYLAAGAGVQTLESSVAAVLKEAQIDANQIIVRGQMDYEAAAKAQTSRVAFKNASELLIENLMDTAGKRLEIAFLYGRAARGLAVADGSTNTNTTTTVVSIDATTWAPGIWSGLEGATLQFYAVSNNALVSSGADSVFTISKVDYVNKDITVTGTTTGISALDSALAADHYIHFKGARTAEPIGLDAIITNAGSLFGIDAGDYAMWAGSSYSFSGAITVAKMLQMVALAVGKGGLMEEADILMPVRGFTALSSTLDGLRHYDGKEKNAVSGFETITMYGPNGKLNIVAHPMVKESESFLAPMKRIKRIGSSEMTFQTPGRKDEIFLHIPDKNAYEMRLYVAQAIIAETPAKCVKGTGITY